MSKKNTTPEFRWRGGYIARPRHQTRVADGVTEHYWTVRNRRAGFKGEWSLGWHSSPRKAEHAFYAWVEALDDQPLATEGHALVIDAIRRYCEAVPDMVSKRPSTIWNRQYTAIRLGDFISEKDPSLTMNRFNDKMFEGYLGWLTTERTIRGQQRVFAPQTIQNFLRGARVFLRWAHDHKYISQPPKEPVFKVEPRVHRPLYQSEAEATIAAAEWPLNIMLKVFWQTGMRFSEAATLRGADLDKTDGVLRICPRGAFQPKTTRSTRWVAIEDELAEELATLVGDDSEAALFQCPVDNPYPYWRHRLYRAQDAAGIGRFTFHDFRRAFAERLRKSGAPVEVYCSILGHSELTGLRHYAVVTPDDQREAQRKALGFVRRRRKKSTDGDGMGSG